jgi:purine-binding chemotaxis protein CheW
MENTNFCENENGVELATFYIGDALCGIDILQIQEINKLSMMTQVPQAPDYVKGILNLRGQIVTVIDLGKKLGLGETDTSLDPRNVIVNSAGNYVGLMVKEISDVVEADMSKQELPPANMLGIQGEFFTGVYKMDNVLIGILDITKVLNTED